MRTTPLKALMLTTSVALVAACADSPTSPEITSTRIKPSLNIEADSNPAICALWGCRTMYQAEWDAISTHLDELWYYHISMGNFDCLNLILEARGHLSGGPSTASIYQGTFNRYTTSNQLVTGSTSVVPPISIYLAPTYASENELRRTLIHEAYHSMNPTDFNETNAYAAESTCS